MHIANKIVFFIVNPLAVTIALLVVAFLMRRTRRLLIAASLLWLWFWSCGITSRIIGLPLEHAWPVTAAEDQPAADAIVLLGGGVSVQKKGFPTPDLKQAADRAWYVAKLYKAGKAPIVIPSNSGAEECDNVFLMDLGVPESAIKLESSARNTEENAKFVGEMLGEGKKYFW